MCLLTGSGEIQNSGLDTHEDTNSHLSVQDLNIRKYLISFISFCHEILVESVQSMAHTF